MKKEINWSEVLLDKNMVLQLLLDASIESVDIDYSFLKKLQETLVLFEINNIGDSDLLARVLELTKNIGKLKLSNESLKPKENELQQEIKELKKSRDENKKKVDNLTEQKQELHVANRQLISESEKLNVEIEQVQISIDNIKAIENKLKTLKNEHDKRAEHKGSYEQEIDRLEEIRDAVSDKEKLLEQKTVDLLDLNTKTQHANHTKEDEIRILEKDYNSILASNNKLVSSIEIIKTNIDSEQSKLSKYQQQEKQLLTNLEAIKSKISDFQLHQEEKDQQLVRKEKLIQNISQFINSPDINLVETLVEEIHELNLDNEGEFNVVLQAVNGYKSRLEFQKKVVSSITSLEKKAKKMDFDISAKQETQQEVDRDDLTRLKQLVEEVRDGISDLKGSYKERNLTDLFRT